MTDSSELDAKIEGLLKLLESFDDKVGFDKLSVEMKDKKADVAALFTNNTVNSSTEIEQLIADYALLLNQYHPDELQDQTGTIDKKQVLCLMAACYYVGFSQGMGKETPMILPLCALSGVGLDEARAFLKEYLLIQYNDTPKD